VSIREKQMETLANLTQADINNGVLVRILASAGIPDVPEYVKQFHEATEDIIIDELEHSDPNKVESDEQIVPPTDLPSWITAFRPRVDKVNQQPIPKSEQRQQQQPEQKKMPTDMKSWITDLGPRLDDPDSPPPVPQQQQQEKPRQLPTDLNSWMHHITPTTLTTSSEETVTPSSTADNNSNIDIPAGDLGTWLNNWTKSLTEQPPPTSLDTWLQSLISENITEPIGKANSSKGRLNTYLNAAQQVLSKHGYDVSNEVIPPTNVHENTGMFGNVKQMYFLVSNHFYSSKSLEVYLLFI